MTKEYNDRTSKELINPGFTLEEYEASKVKVFTWDDIPF